MPSSNDTPLGRGIYWSLVSRANIAFSKLGTAGLPINGIWFAAFCLRATIKFSSGLFPIRAMTYLIMSDTVDALAFL